MLIASSLARSSLTSAALAISAISAATRAQEAPTLGEVQVLESNDSTGYQGARRNTAATRTDTPLVETPQAVRVLPRQFVDDLGATRLADTVDFVSGITRLNDFGGTWDNYAIRGFSNTDGGFLLNGFTTGRGYGPQRDTATVERIEFLKGPVASLYGSSEPGGTLNIVTKKPQFTRAHTADLQIGSLGLRRSTFDSTGPLGKSVAYRLNVAAEDGASRSDLVDSKKYVVAPALTWLIDDHTVLQYEAEFIRIRTPLDRGIVQVAGDPGALPRDRYLGEPTRDNLHVGGNTHQLTLDRDLGNGWRTRVGASYRETEFTGEAVDLNGTLRSDRRTLTRRDSWRSLPSRDSAVQAEVEGKLRTGAFTHTVLAGVSTSRLTMGQNIWYSNLAAQPFAIDIDNPTYGAPHGVLSRGFWTDDRQRATGVFLQDQVDLTAKWKLLAGVRFDRFDQTLTDMLANTRQVQRHSAASPRLGLTYMLSDRSSVYVSAGRSFRPNAGLAENGIAFDPQKGTAFEAGAKWASADERLNGSVAVFDIKKSNVLTPSSTNSSFSVAAGEVRSRGIEADLAGQLDAHWRLSANAAFTDAKVTRDNSPALLDKRLVNIPRVSAGLFVMREDALAHGGRYGVGGGLVHVGERTGTATDTYRLPAYTTVRLTSYWQMDARTRFMLEVHNLFDKTYYAASWGALTVLPGLGRQVVASVKVAF